MRAIGLCLRVIGRKLRPGELDSRQTLGDFIFGGKDLVEPASGRFNNSRTIDSLDGPIRRVMSFQGVYEAK
jgi:hypothetical protein